MRFPKVAELVDGFRVESVKVEHVSVDSGWYEYPIEVVVEGKGGKEQVRRAFRRFFDARRILFSGYGNPYQCVPGKMQIENLGGGRFLIAARGTCVRIYLRDELVRFLGYLSDRGCQLEIDESRVNVVEDYLKQYRVDSERGR